MINIKKQDPVADAVKDILQQEALKGNQHKIDKNKNNKIDAHDFKILRGEKPEVKKEEVKDEYARKVDKYLRKKYNKEEVEPVEETWEDMKQATKERADKEEKEKGTGKFNKKEMKPGVVQYTKKPVKYEPAQKPKNEEVESVDEASYSATAAVAGKDIGKPGKAFSMIAKKAGQKYGSKERGEKVAGAILKKLRMKEDVELLDEEIDELIALEERTMSPGETAEKERIVKGMKKSLKGFKSRYGEKAKSVMYATATKRAMGEEAVSEGKRPEDDSVPFAPPYNTTSSPAATVDKSGAKHTPISRVKHLAKMAMKKVSSDLKTK